MGVAFPCDPGVTELREGRKEALAIVFLESYHAFIIISSWSMCQLLYQTSNGERGRGIILKEYPCHGGDRITERNRQESELWYSAPKRRVSRTGMQSLLGERH